MYGGRTLQVNAPKQQVLLASLLLRANRVVPTEELVRRLWDADPPRESRAALQVHMARLRGLLKADGALSNGDRPLISTQPGGYRISVPRDSLDLFRYRKLVDRAREARRSDHLTGELALIKEALGQWRGEALSLVGSASLQREVVPQLQEDRLAQLERRFDLELALGQHADVIAEIRALAAEHLLRERFRGQLMLALYRSGRPAAALDAYRAYARLLDRELGIRPGDDIQLLHSRMLSNAAELDLPADAPVRTPKPATVPPLGEASRFWQVQCQLPTDIPDFVGRAELLEAVLAELSPDALRTAVPVISLVGPPGGGKTALALRAGHRLAPHFPDGQWYVRLSDTCGVRRTGEEILSELLRASGAEVGSPSVGRDHLAKTFRSRLAGRRVLLVLDDVHDAEQINDLLPGTPACAVLAVSQDNLPELVTLYGARTFTVDLLSATDSARLLTAMVGVERTAAAASDVAELVEICGRLPLALRIAGGQLASRPWRSIESFVAELRDGDPLAVLAVGDTPRTALRAAFSLAYRALPALSQRFFRMLGTAPDVTLTADTAARLLGVDASVAAQLLYRLADAHLIEIEAPERYRFHRLIALFAAERGRAEDEHAERQQALRRLCDWYLRRTEAAVRACYPGFIRMPSPEGGEPDVRPDEDEHVAQAWLRTEHANLVAVTVRASDEGLGLVSVRLADMLRGYFMLGRHSTDWLTVTQAGLAAAEATDQPCAAAVMRLGMGLALQGLNRLEEATACLTTACREFERLGVSDFEAVAVNALAMNQLQQPTKRFDQAVALLERGLDLARTLGLLHVESRSQMYLGMARHGQGELSPAYDHLRRSVAILEELDVQRSLSEVLVRLGVVCCDLGRYHEAAGYLCRALRMSQDFQAVHSAALASYGLARVYRGTGETQLALQHAEDVLRISREQNYLALEANARNLLGSLRLTQGHLELAGTEFQAARATANEIGHPQAAAEALIGLARLDLAVGRPLEACDHAARALEASSGSGLKLYQARALAVLGVAETRAGDPAAGSRHLSAAAAISAAMVGDTGPDGPCRAFPWLADLPDASGTTGA
ncbi:BTAD domain-containing putative transcriptional regulator [Kitasatospora sp. MAA4]|uniref:AfsR/SARP family transcriptional regulator n=1 Tax=Kitasatospora sp. MAA4 TaxID=3035093 RepID=UPI0024743A07|nr:BTAD domain-containing putative transcriptional regulator [Kitasatospora sp. MAA4]